MANTSARIMQAIGNANQFETGDSGRAQSFRSVGLGNGQPLIFTKSNVKKELPNFLKAFKVLPKNYISLMQSGSNQTKSIVFQYVLCKISAVAKIQYPKGLRELEKRLLKIASNYNSNDNDEEESNDDDNDDNDEDDRNNDDYDYSSPENFSDSDLNMTDFLYSKLFVHLSVEQSSTFQAFSLSESTRTAIHFSQQTSTQPQNRFAHIYGSHNLCTVSFSVPHIQLQDIIKPGKISHGIQLQNSLEALKNTAQQENVRNSELRTALQDTLALLRKGSQQYVHSRTLENALAQLPATDSTSPLGFPQHISSTATKLDKAISFSLRLRFQEELQSIVAGKKASISNELQLWERQLLARDSMRLSNRIGSTLRFAQKKWDLISMNIAGALTHRFVYSSEPWEKVLKETIPLSLNSNGYFPTDKPMSTFLRMGLLNTTCVKVITSNFMNEKVEVLKEKDVINSNKEAMNDGCARVSPDLAEKMMEGYKTNWFEVKPSTQLSQFDTTHQHLESGFNALSSDFTSTNNPSPDLPNPNVLGNFIPSAFQIRFRGCKGMLVVDRSLSGLCMVLTDSMIKFKTYNEKTGTLGSLFIAGLAGPVSKVMLSSELISMFEGCCKVEFREELFQYLKRVIIDKRLDCGENSLANIHSQPELGTKLLKYRRDESSKHLLLSDTFISYLAQLNAPLPKSAHLYGVADFSGRLLEGQVFLQVPDENGNGYQVVTGPVLLAKTPSLKKKDLVLFTAVNYSELHHLKNVLVFSLQGNNKPAASQVSSADLDGDHFYAMWDKELLGCLNVKEAVKSDIDQSASIVRQNPTLFSSHPIPQSSSALISQDISKARDDALQTLRKSVNSYDFCSLQHLLELRRRFMDSLGWEWANDETMKALASFIERTFEAPKHGDWVEWAELRQILNNRKLPPFPHYYERVSRSSLQRSPSSSSLFAKLYDSLMDVFCNTNSETTLMEQLNFWQQFCRAHFETDFSGLYASEQEELSEKKAKLIEQAEKQKNILDSSPNVTSSQLLRAIAFFRVVGMDFADSNDPSYLINHERMHSIGVFQNTYSGAVLTELTSLIENGFNPRIFIAVLEGIHLNSELYTPEGKLKWPYYFKFLLKVIDLKQKEDPKTLTLLLREYCRVKFKALTLFMADPSLLLQNDRENKEFPSFLQFPRLAKEVGFKLKWREIAPPPLSKELISDINMLSEWLPQPGERVKEVEDVFKRLGYQISDKKIILNFPTTDSLKCYATGCEKGSYLYFAFDTHDNLARFVDVMPNWIRCFTGVFELMGHFNIRKQVLQNSAVYDFNCKKSYLSLCKFRLLKPLPPKAFEIHLLDELEKHFWLAETKVKMLRFFCSLVIIPIIILLFSLSNF